MRALRTPPPVPEKSIHRNAWTAEDPDANRRGRPREQAPPGVDDSRLPTLTHRRLGVGPLAGQMRSELFLCTDRKTLRITERITRLLCPSSEPGPRHPPQQVADRYRLIRLPPSDNRKSRFHNDQDQEEL